MNTHFCANLKIDHVKNQDYPILTLEFEPLVNHFESMVAIESFNLDACYLVEVPLHPDRLALQDPDGHRYCGIKKSEPWLLAAESRGTFLMILHLDLPADEVFGRILMVRFPFGHVVHDTKPFRISGSDFRLALQDGIFAAHAMDQIHVSTNTLIN